MSRAILFGILVVPCVCSGLRPIPRCRRSSCAQGVSRAGQAQFKKDRATMERLIRPTTMSIPTPMAR